MARDRIKLKGIFELKVWCAVTGKLLSSHKDKNLIVNLGRNIVVNMLGGDAAGNQNITNIGFGTSATAPALGDSTLAALYSKVIASHSYPSTGAIQIDWTLEAIENNGVSIAEYGLICGDGSLFSRKVHTPVIIKTSSIRLTGTWTITF